MTGGDRSGSDKTAGRGGRDDYALSGSVSHMLHRAQQMAADAFSRAHNGDELTFRQFAVLAAVAETPGASQSDLVRATGIDRSTLADMIARMEKKSLLSRETSKKDGRAKSVKLTGRGQKKLSEAAPVAAKADEAILSFLPKTKQKTFLDLLVTLQITAENAALIAPADNGGIEKKARKGVKKAAKKKPKR